jgi:hypothetical protein
VGEKTAGVGHFTIPTAPAAGTSCTSGAANVFTTTYVQLIASTSAALYITGIYVEEAGVSAATYIVVQLATGGAGSETVVGQHLIAPVTGSTVTRCYKAIYPPIPVANAARIACKTADSVGAAAKLITLECINQSNVVDDGVAQSCNVTQWNSTNVSSPATAGIPDVNVKNINNVAAATPGAAGGLFIAGTNAATTVTTSFTTTFTGNLTGSVGSVTGAVGSVTGAVGSVTGNVGGNVVGSVASVTAAVTLPSIPANWITAAGITAAALNGKGDWMVSYTQPTGFLAATFPATVASTTNITAGTITTATNLTNAPTVGDFTAAMKTSLNAATPASVVGAVGSVTGNVGGNVTGSVGSVVGLTAANLDVAVSTRSTFDPSVTVVEGSTTWRQAARGWNSALFGKASGLSTTTAVFRDVADTKDRITATVDTSGNRSAVTLDLT